MNIPKYENTISTSPKNRLCPAGYVVSAEQVAEDRDQQPEPQHEYEYRKDVGQKVGESETAWKQHVSPPFTGTRMPPPDGNSTRGFRSCCPHPRQSRLPASPPSDRRQQPSTAR